MTKKKELSLFTGAGGGVLGGKLLGWEPVAFVEFNGDAQKMLKARIKDGALPDVPVFSDVRNFDGTKWKGKIDVLTAGFPCQPFSVAGARKAANDDRNMWPDTIRIMKESDVKEALLENVTGLLSAGFGYFGQVIRDISNAGYAAVWDCLSAASVAAPHRRDRLWVYCWKPQPGWKPKGRSVYAKMDDNDLWKLQDRKSLFLEDVGKGDDFKGPWRRAGFVWKGVAYVLPSSTSSDGKTADGGYPTVALQQFKKHTQKTYWKPYPNVFHENPQRPQPEWFIQPPYHIDIRTIWPTPLSGSNRKSKESLMSKESGGVGTGPGLEQSIEIAAGILPSELHNIPVENMSQKTRELLENRERTQTSPLFPETCDWPQAEYNFESKEEHVIHLINSGHMTWQEGIDALGHDPFRAYWPTPLAGMPGSRPNGKGGKVLEEVKQKVKKKVNVTDGVDRRNWPTPAAQQAGDNDEFLDKLKTKNGGEPQPGERLYVKGVEKHTQVTLNRAVKLWPTPSSTDGSRTGKELNVDHWLKAKERHAQKGVSKQFHLDIAVQFAEEGRSPEEPRTKWCTPCHRDWKDDCNPDYLIRKHEEGYTTLPRQMAYIEQRQTFPTPLKGDGEGGPRPHLVSRNKNGKLVLRKADPNNQKVWTPKLSEAIEFMELVEREQWPTPTAHMEKGGQSHRVFRPETGAGFKLKKADSNNQAIFGAKLNDAVEFVESVEKQESWPTPTATDFKQDIHDSGEYAKVRQENGNQIGLPCAVKLRDREEWETPTAGFNHLEPRTGDALERVLYRGDPDRKSKRKTTGNLHENPKLWEERQQPQGLSVESKNLEDALESWPGIILQQPGFPTPTCRDASVQKARTPEQLVRRDGRKVLRVPGLAEVMMQPENMPYKVEDLEKMKEGDEYNVGVHIGSRETWSTPVVQDAAGSGTNSSIIQATNGQVRQKLVYQIERGDEIQAFKETGIEMQKSEEERRKGRLNPDWVEWLMGWPLGWTKTEEGSTKEDVEFWVTRFSLNAWWYQEPLHIPRITTTRKSRVARLKALGNGQVPACMAAAWLVLEATARELEAEKEEEIGLMDLFGG